MDEEWLLGAIDETLKLGLAVDHSQAYRFEGGSIGGAGERDTASFPSRHQRGGSKQFVARIGKRWRFLPHPMEQSPKVATR
jgi:hypothetical protein